MVNAILHVAVDAFVVMLDCAIVAVTVCHDFFSLFLLAGANIVYPFKIILYERRCACVSVRFV